MSASILILPAIVLLVTLAYTIHTFARTRAEARRAALLRAHRQATEAASRREAELVDAQHDGLRAQYFLQDALRDRIRETRMNTVFASLAAAGYSYGHQPDPYALPQEERAAAFATSSDDFSDDLHRYDSDRLVQNNPFSEVDDWPRRISDSAASLDYDPMPTAGADFSDQLTGYYGSGL